MKFTLTTLIVALLATNISFSQVIGGRDNSEMSPKEAEATKLSGGGFVGDVNTMTGEFQASIPLGSVATPGGLNYSLSLNHTSSFSFSNNQPMTAGIPYGDGWSPSIPTISIETDVFEKFSCTTYATDGGVNPLHTVLNYNDSGEFDGTDQGDLYWFSPTVNIPGGPSGRAIFKYVDVHDSKCLVFVLNKFESPVELRFYGDSWTILLADGTRYEMGTHLANYVAPANTRVIKYDQSTGDGDSYGLAPGDQNPMRDVVNANDYGAYTEHIENAIMPKTSYSVWYCDRIYNLNIPLQSIGFKYEKFGEFNYFQEFLQNRFVTASTNKLNSTGNTDFSAYTDVFLKKVTSFVIGSPVDIIDLDYQTITDLTNASIQNSILDFSAPGVSRKDSLYNYKTVAHFGGNDDFVGWRRYKHAAHPDHYSGTTTVDHMDNPYLSGNYYSVEGIGNDTEIPFDHSYLESNRLFNGQHLYPGDIYEIKTKVTRPNGNDLDIGNGTLDIAIKTGTFNNGPGNESNNYSSMPTGNHVQQADVDLRTEVEVFSTFNSAVKWQMGYGQAILETSNLFMMPNIPSTYHGFNIQIGPGNSDVDFAARFDDGHYSTEPFLDNGNINIMEAYPFESPKRPVKAHAKIPHIFGTGHPWGLMIPLYNEMCVSGQSWTNGSPATPDQLYDEIWWKPMDENSFNSRSNIPTKFDENVELAEVELIRYSKNPYMLKGVKNYKISGEYGAFLDSTMGQHLVSQKKFEYDLKYEKIIRNYDYDEEDLINSIPADPISMENYHNNTILLTFVRDVPVNIDLDSNFFVNGDTSKILTTRLEYTKVLDNASANGLPFDQMKPWQGVSKYTLSRYTDHLGGITEVEFYGVNDAPTRISGVYSPMKCGSIVTKEALARNKAYNAHFAVRYLAKNDEDDMVRTHTNPFSTYSNITLHKVWEYVYDDTYIIINPISYHLPDPHFKQFSFTRSENAFGKVKVYSPHLEDGSRTYKYYEFYGNPAEAPGVVNDPTLEEYLYYGKLKTTKTYGIDPLGNETLHDETIINYGNTLAFVNAMKRPNPYREFITDLEGLFTRSYEYEDIYKDEILHVYNDYYLYDNSNPPQVTDTIVTVDEYGGDALEHLIIPYITGNYTDKEHPKLMEFYFYDELVNDNHEFLFDSYFIKKTSEINRVYENLLTKSGGAVNPTAPPLINNTYSNPFGTGVINPINTDLDRDTPLMDMITNDASEYSAGQLISLSPLSDTVLIHMLGSEMTSFDKGNVLAVQSGLSNYVIESLIIRRSHMADEDLTKVINSQNYFTDESQQFLLQNISEEDNYNFVRNFLLKNPYLSAPVVSFMTNTEINLPAETFSDVLAEQPQMSDSVLQLIAASGNLTSVNLGRTLENQVLSDAIYTIILNQSDYKNPDIKSLVVNGIGFPSDNTLIGIINRDPSFSEREIESIFAKKDRSISASVEATLRTKYAEEFVDGLVLTPYTGNPLNAYCNNAVVETRDFIETKTDYEYYEADWRGTAVGKAYEMLLGHRSNVNDPSPYPFTVNSAIYSSDNTNKTETVSALRLKHEPSWQVYSVETTSPHLPEAYNREEYYYLFDLQNRYDRYWYNYDLESGKYEVRSYDELSAQGISADTTTIFSEWDPEYANYNSPSIPKFDGMERSRTNKTRDIAFQKTTISKNTRDEQPLIRSEYYHYDSRWNFNDLVKEYETIHYQGDTCSTPNTTCTDIVQCTDCFTVKYISDEQIASLVGPGWCAWQNYGNNGLTNTWYICPYGTDVNGYVPGATSQVCNLGATQNNLPPVNPENVVMAKEALHSSVLSKGLLLRTVTVQVDTLNHEKTPLFPTKKMDTKNEYIVDFTLGSLSVQDTGNFNAPYAMIYPFDKLTVRTINTRNRHLQTAFETNQVGLETKYYYDKSKMYWHVNDNCNLDNYQTTEVGNIGLPYRITVGYNLPDSLSTTYEYNEIGMVTKVTEPNGHYLEYSFDNYHRLTSTLENGVRHLNDIEYNNWEHEDTMSFTGRIEENYVKTNIYNDDPSLDPNGINNERRKAFMDPMGRGHSVVSAYSTTPFNHVEIHSGKVVYDNWSRIILSYKKHHLDSVSSLGIPKISPSNKTTVPFSKSLFENDPKSRVFRIANYDVDVMSIHAVKSNFAIANSIYTSCELGLDEIELPLIMKSGTVNTFRFYRTEVVDQDDKRTVEYTNAFGQKVGTIKYLGGTGNPKVVTLFVYDSYGNLTKVINPEKQESNYTFNILGQLVIEETPDAGLKKYQYNKLGLVSKTLDEQGRYHAAAKNGLPGNLINDDITPVYRAYQYDDFGRNIAIIRYVTDYYQTNSNSNYGSFHSDLCYENTFVGQGLGIPNDGGSPELHMYFNYIFSNASTLDWLGGTSEVWSMNGVDPTGNPTYGVTNGGFIKVWIYEKAFTYGSNVNDPNIGKLVNTLSYDNDGVPVQSVSYTYDNYNNITQQVTKFNPDINVTLNDPTNIVSVIDYKKYNYRNSLLEQTVKVNTNVSNNVNYHCFIDYDQLNRLKAIYAATGEVANKGEATLLVTYEHDDANGLIERKNHFVDDVTLSTLVQSIEYSYDSRDRLTDIDANHSGNTMMNYHLYYDDQMPFYNDAINGTTEFVNYSTNWNGNINGTKMSYDFEVPSVIVSPINPQLPLLYGYEYDQINRLTFADATVGDWIDQGNYAATHQIGDVTLSYDKIGNIKTLHRTSYDLSTSTNVIQHWNYQYQSGNNRLTQANGYSGTATRNYTYDANGNLYSDDFNGITSTEYGRASYPFALEINGENQEYLYSVDDQRIYKKTITTSGVSEDYYLSNAFGQTIAIMHNDSWEYYVYGSERECKFTAEGDAQINVGDVEFYIYDHLGNTRIVYQPVYREGTNDVMIKVNSVIDYFPYGKELRWGYLNGDTERFMTTQHERDQETSFDYRGARYYDSDISRFLSLDPLASKFSSWSDYNYVLNNPVILVDKDGKEPYPPASAAYLAGVKNSLYSNMVYFGFGRDVAADIFPDDEVAQAEFLRGQMTGDVMSIVMGGTEAGTGASIGGASIAATSEGVVIALPGAIAGGIAFAHGTSTVTNGAIGYHNASAQLVALKMANNGSSESTGNEETSTSSEIKIKAKDVNQGRNKAQELTGLGKGSKWYYGRMKHNKGQKVGLQKRDANGNIVRYRYDIDADGNFHINVEDFRTGKGTNGKKYRIDIPGGKEAYMKKISELNR